MNLYDYLLTKTNVNELCVICRDYYVQGVVWIDHEDTFSLPKAVSSSDIVLRDEWKAMPITDANNERKEVQCHFIHIA